MSPPPSDAGGPDAPPACTGSAECDDGRFCNGTESCASGACVAGTMACGAGVACDEAREVCGAACSDPDADRDGSDALECGGTDCDDTDPGRYPGNAEVCDAVDQDCDETTFGARDGDGDGAISDTCCNGTRCGPDCDDTTLARRPSQLEICDSIDNDCDGASDEAMNDVPWYPDTDGDLFGDGSATPTASCTPIVGSSLLGTDCDDTRVSASPVATETCNGADDDCDGSVDETCADAGVPFDGGLDAGVPSDAGVGCVLPQSVVVTGEPAYFEIDGAGACRLTGTSGTLPIGVLTVGFLAGEGTPIEAGVNVQGGIVSVVPSGSFGVFSRTIPFDTDVTVVMQLGAAGGFRYATVVLRWTEATDTITVVSLDLAPCASRMAAELTTACDALNSDCDATTDEGVSLSYYLDSDDDGAGAGAPLAIGCGSLVPPTHVAVGGDCDDFDSLRSPLLPELCAGGDENCDGTIDENPDADSSCTRPFTTASCTGGACVVSGCSGAYEDCDGDGANGCEANTDTSSAHCGSCDVPCGDTCSAGGCSITPVRDVAAAPTLRSSHACLVRESGRVLCVGENGRGQLGDGTTTDRTTPVVVEGLPSAIDAELGVSSSCAVLTDGRIACWGEASDLPDSSPVTGAAYRTLMVMAGPAMTEVDGAEIALGDGAACVRHGAPGTRFTAGMVSCTTSGGILTAVAGITDAVDVAAGEGHVCIARATGAVLCFGLNNRGQVGDGTTMNRSTPRTVVGLTDAIAVSAAGSTSCALRMGGGVVCWGEATGPGFTDSSTPVAVSGIAGASAIDVGDGYGCAIVGTTATCFGLNSAGQFGPGVSTGLHAVAVAVPGVGSVTRVSSGSSDVNCYARSDGTFACYPGF